MAANNFSTKNPLSKRDAGDVSYELEQEFIAIPGTTVRILLEFPQYNIHGKTAIIQLDDAMTISFSSYRVKAPVTLLGQTSVSGYGLGTRMVAGSLIRTIFTTDKLTELQSKIFLEDQKNIKNRLKGLGGVPTGLPLKDQISIVQDDLTSFNIHMYAATEYTHKLGEERVPFERFETIIGAVVTNTGQVYSIEDLITESTISFQAKAIRSSTNITDYSRGYGASGTYPSVTSIMNKDLKKQNITNLKGG